MKKIPTFEEYSFDSNKINEEIEIMKNIPTFEEFVNESQLNRLYEGHMSELIILAQEAKDYADFVKSAMKEYPQLKKEKDLEAWLNSIYDTAVNESVKFETIGDALDDQSAAAFDILWNIAKKYGKVKGLSKIDTKRLRPGYVNMFIEDLVDAGKIKLTDKIQESAEEFINESKVSWVEKSGVVEFKIHGTSYSLYNIDKKATWELYKFNEDNGPMIMRFEIKDGNLILLYGGFDLDTITRAYTNEIIEAICSYFKIDSKKIVYKN